MEDSVQLGRSSWCFKWRHIHLMKLIESYCVFLSSCSNYSFSFRLRIVIIFIHWFSSSLFWNKNFFSRYKGKIYSSHARCWNSQVRTFREYTILTLLSFKVNKLERLILFLLVSLIFSYSRIHASVYVSKYVVKLNQI